MPRLFIRASDPANTASKLPRPLQWPVGAALGGLKSVFGDIPNPAMTTIGPGAIPLGDEAGYLRKVMGTAIDDLSEASNKYGLQKWHLGRKPMPSQVSGSFKALRAPETTPLINGLVEGGADEMRRYKEINDSGLGIPNRSEWWGRRNLNNALDAQDNDPRFQDYILQTLADIYHKGLGK